MTVYVRSIRDLLFNVAFFANMCRRSSWGRVDVLAAAVDEDRARPGGAW